MNQVVIQYSKGRGRNGQLYAYIRPAKKCFNRSRRCKAEKVPETIERHFSTIHYYHVDGYVIGAKDENAALREYWRVCEKDKIGKAFSVSKI